MIWFGVQVRRFHDRPEQSQQDLQAVLLINTGHQRHSSANVGLGLRQDGGHSGQEALTFTHVFFLSFPQLYSCRRAVTDNTTTLSPEKID